jgi:hypothetical protein
MHLLPRLPKAQQANAGTDETPPSNAVAVLASADAPPVGDTSDGGTPAAATAASSSVASSPQHTSLDTGKRIVKSRAEQAVEAREYAVWLREAEVPEFLRMQTDLHFQLD